jgi:hypothetical protein
VLSCRLAPTHAPSMRHGQCADSEAICTLNGPHLSSGVGSEALCARLLVSFWCEDTRHVGSLDLNSGRNWTCSWNMDYGAPLASHWVELAPGQSVGPASDPMAHPGLDQGGAALAWCRGYPSPRVSTVDAPLPHQHWRC